MNAPIAIRTATVADAPAVLEIYRPFVESSAVSFELAVPSVEEIRKRIEHYAADWAWLVAEQGGRCAGYAYASPLRDRQAYRWSAESSAYVHPDFYRKGIGQRLYRALFEALAAKGICNVYAGVALPNDASIEFHRALGFTRVGVFSKVGRKFSQWHDVSWWQRTLRDAPPVD